MSLYYRDSSGKETVIASTGLTTADLADYATLESDVATLKSIVPPRYWFRELSSQSTTTNKYNIIKLGYGSMNEQDDKYCVLYTSSYNGYYGAVIDCATGNWSYTYYNATTAPTTKIFSYIHGVYWDSATRTLYLKSNANQGWRNLFMHTGGTREVLSFSQTLTKPEGITFNPLTYIESWLHKQ